MKEVIALTLAAVGVVAQVFASVFLWLQHRQEKKKGMPYCTFVIENQHDSDLSVVSVFFFPDERPFVATRIELDGFDLSRRFIFEQRASGKPRKPPEPEEADWVKAIKKIFMIPAKIGMKGMTTKIENGMTTTRPVDLHICLCMYARPRKPKSEMIMRITGKKYLWFFGHPDIEAREIPLCRVDNSD